MCVQCTYFYHDCCTPLHAHYMYRFQVVIGDVGGGGSGYNSVFFGAVGSSTSDTPSSTTK